MEARVRATSRTAKEFLDTVQRNMPLNVRAIRFDGRLEFYSDFEQECERTGIKLFVLPLMSPKLNGSVERAQRTHTEEFYEVNDCPWTVPELNRELGHWNHIHNCVRPHQALGYKTPLQFFS